MRLGPEPFENSHLSIGHNEIGMPEKGKGKQMRTLFFLCQAKFWAICYAYDKNSVI